MDDVITFTSPVCARLGFECKTWRNGTVAQYTQTPYLNRHLSQIQPTFSLLNDLTRYEGELVLIATCNTMATYTTIEMKYLVDRQDINSNDSLIT